MYLLIATCGPVVCHIGASCLPHLGHMWARQRSHVAHTWATVAKNVWPTCVPIGGSHFNCHMWALCGPLVECLLGRKHTCTRSRTCAPSHARAHVREPASAHSRYHKHTHTLTHTYIRTFTCAHSRAPRTHARTYVYLRGPS